MCGALSHVSASCGLLKSAHRKGREPCRSIPHIPPSVWLWNDRNAQPELPVSWSEEPLEPRREDSDDERDVPELSGRTAWAGAATQRRSHRKAYQLTAEPDS